MEFNHQTVSQLVTDALSHQIPTIEPEEINLTDHLEDDLLLTMRTDVPKIVRRIEQEVEMTIDREALEDFLSEAEEDPEKGTVGELVSFIKDELLYN